MLLETHLARDKSPPAQRSASPGSRMRGRDVEALACVLLPEIQAYFESEEGQREYAEWKRQQAVGKSKQE